MTVDDDRARRARERSGWPGKLTRLEDGEEVELVAGDPVELIAAVTELTFAAWAMRGTPIPDYARAQAPGRMIRPGDDR